MNIGISSDVRVRFHPLVLKAFTLLKAYFFSIHWLKRPDEYRDIFGCEGSIPSFGTQSLHIVEGLFFSLHWLKRPDEYRDIFGCVVLISFFFIQNPHIIESLFFFLFAG